MTTITMKEVAAFLLGEAPLDGFWFGERHPAGGFWWREHLRAALAAPAAAPDDRHAQELLAQDITIANMRERHAQELCAYELTVQNLRAELDLALSQLAAEGRINSETLKVLEAVEKKLDAAMSAQEKS